MPITKPSVLHTPLILALGRQANGFEFQASVAYTEKPCFKQTTSKSKTTGRLALAKKSYKHPGMVTSLCFSPSYIGSSDNGNPEI
jgi:pimeloyl-CoA synthetase